VMVFCCGVIASPFYRQSQPVLRQYSIAVVSQETSGDVALFLPFGCTKERQTAAQSETGKSFDTRCDAARSGASSTQRQRLTTLFPPVNRRVAGLSRRSLSEGGFESSPRSHPQKDKDEISTSGYRSVGIVNDASPRRVSRDGRFMIATCGGPRSRVAPGAL
jgi:hypothetical protein